MTCRHLWRPYADQKRIWQECDKCGLAEHVTTHREQLADTLGYVMGSLHEPPSSSSTARSESGGGTTTTHVRPLDGRGLEAATRTLDTGPYAQMDDAYKRMAAATAIRAYLDGVGR